MARSLAAAVATVLAAFALWSPSIASGASDLNWIATQAPLPTGAAADTTANLASVSCAGDQWCVAVGSDSSNGQPLIETFSDGAWSSEELSVAGTLNSVSCPEAGSCVAVGSTENITSDTLPLIETLASGDWTQAAPSLPMNADSNPLASLASVSCAGDGTCAAVGSYTDASSTVQALTETLGDGTWTGGSNASGTSVGQSLSSVDCQTGGFCAAVGTSSASSPTYDNQALAVTMSSDAWAYEIPALPGNANPAPGPGTYGSSLTRVSCLSAGACSAVGWYTDEDIGGDSQVGLIEDLFSGSWLEDQAPLPSGISADSTGFMESVSCSSQLCAAAGFYDDPSNGYIQSLDTTTGLGRSATDAPLPPDAFGSGSPWYLNSVSCVADSCQAVGRYPNTSQVSEGVIESLSAGLWDATTAPQPSDFVSGDPWFLFNVSCGSATACVAAGSYTSAALGSTAMLDSTLLTVDQHDPPDAEVAHDYEYELPTSGGVEPYSYTLVDGSLPKGLSLDDTTGVISGTPTEVGMSDFTILINDAESPRSEVTNAYELNVRGLEVSGSCPDGTVDDDYSADLSASGGTEPYKWAVADGKLPEGLSLDESTGEISGKPTEAGTVDFTIEVNDSSAQPLSGIAECTVTISDPPPPPAELTGRIKRALKKMLGHTGYKFSFAPPTPGKLLLSWSTTEKSRSVLVAAATVTVKSDHTVKFAIKLTRMGRQLLKRAHKLKLTATATFTADRYAAITIDKRLTLRQ